MRTTLTRWTALPVGGSRRIRRIRVLACYGGLALAASAWIFLRSASLHGLLVIAAHAGAIVVALALAVALASLISLLPWVRLSATTSTVRDILTTERRDRAIILAFRFMTVICALQYFVWIMLVASSHTIADLPVIVLASNAVLTLTLPAVILAWEEPEAGDPGR